MNFTWYHPVFTYLPQCSLLHSRDLVHWELINYCMKHLPLKRYDQPAHGCGCWAPSIRKHDGKFYVFVPLPDEGIFVATATDPYGKWELHCLHTACGWIDPCPLWDDDGKTYMAFLHMQKPMWDQTPYQYFRKYLRMHPAPFIRSRYGI